MRNILRDSFNADVLNSGWREYIYFAIVIPKTLRKLLEKTNRKNLPADRVRLLGGVLSRDLRQGERILIGQMGQSSQDLKKVFFFPTGQAAFTFDAPFAALLLL